MFSTVLNPLMAIITNAAIWGKVVNFPGDMGV